LEIGDDVLLVTLHPAGNHGDEHVQDHAGPRVRSRDAIVRSSIRPT
jgi:hypothetical protein